MLGSGHTWTVPFGGGHAYYKVMNANGETPPASGIEAKLGLRWPRRAPAAPYKSMDDLALPDRDKVNPDAAKAALDQVHKRQDALLAAKTSTENRALTLAGHCMTALVAVTGAGFWAVTAQQWLILAATIGGGVCMLTALCCALRVISPRYDLTLPGRLPDELWRQLTWPNMTPGDFIMQYLRNVQNGMVRNEIAQRARAGWLRATVWAALLAVPVALLAALLFHCSRVYGGI